MLAVVLSGGGAKGAYQIGVWRALRKLNIKYDIITGTSVGALNGAMMVTGDYKRAYKIWKNLNYDKILDNSNFNNEHDVIKYYAKSFIKTGGASISSLESLVEEAVDEKKFYKSKINFGLITVNLSKFESKAIIKKDIEKEYLKKYIIASATCYPFFKKKMIDDNNYIDGGFFDNLPINLAISLGATDIIAIDLKAVGIKQRVKNKNVNIKYISPRNETGSFLAFESTGTRKNIQLGYNDTMKSFYKLDGDKYTFKLGQLEKNYHKYFNKFINIIKELYNDDYLNKLFKFNNDKKDYNEHDIFVSFNHLIEQLGELLKINPVPIYRIRDYNKLLKKEIVNINSLNKHDGVKKIINMVHSEQVLKYIYELLNDDVLNNKKRIMNYDLLYSKEIFMAVYLYVIK